MNIPEIKGNPINTKEPEQRKKQKKIASAVSKKNINRRIAQFIFGEEADSLGGYFIRELLIPAGRQVVGDLFGNISDAISASISGTPTHTHISNGNRINYHVYSTGKGQSPSSRSKSSRRNNTDELIFQNKSEAQEVLSTLCDLIENYDIASVSDFYELCGITPDYTDEKYGWTSMSGSKIIRVRGGYSLVLPRTELL